MLELLSILIASFLGALALFGVIPGTPPVPPGFLALSVAIAILIGYLMAGTFFLWDSTHSRASRITFAIVVGLLSVVNGCFLLGALFGRAFALSFVPAHAGMLGWYFGVIGSTVVTALVARLVVGIPRRGSEGPVVSTVSAERSAMWGLGVGAWLFLMLGHAVIGPVIFTQFGPDASYESAIGSAVRSIVFLGPALTLVGVSVERFTRGRDSRRQWIIALWLVAVIVSVVEVTARYVGAKNSPNGRWWVEHQRPKP